MSKKIPAARLLLMASVVSTSPGQLAAQTGNSLALEEVLVTATKREHSLQDVSVAVTALTEDIIREAQIHSSEDLRLLVPSLNLQKGSNPRQSSFNICGIGTQSYCTAVEPSVSTMVVSWTIDKVIAGDVPETLSLERLKRGFPLDWREQRSHFGLSQIHGHT